MKKAFVCLFVAFATMMCLVGHGMAQKPNETPVRIGIAWRADTESEFYTNVVAAITEAGGIPVLLNQVKAKDVVYNGIAIDPSYFDAQGVLLQPYADSIKNGLWTAPSLSFILKGIDAVVFTGGEDVSPSLMREPQPWHGIEAELDYNATRDVSDYLLMQWCLEKDIPVMGFCRGMQMLSVVSGASIIQDIPTFFAQQGMEYRYEHRNQAEPGQYRDYAPHNVVVTDKSSILYRMAESNTITGAPSWHHQAVRSVTATPLKVTGVAPTNGIDIIEAVERTDKSFAIGLQFHPEAAVVKRIDEDANASDYMTYDDAIRCFQVLVQHVRDSKRHDSLQRNEIVVINDNGNDGVGRMELFCMPKGSQKSYYLSVGNLGLGDDIVQVYLDPAFELFIPLGNTLDEAQTRLEQMKALFDRPKGTSMEVQGCLDFGFPGNDFETVTVTHTRALFTRQLKFSMNHDGYLRATYIPRSDIKSLISSLKFYRKIHPKEM